MEKVIIIIFLNKLCMQITKIYLFIHVVSFFKWASGYLLIDIAYLFYSIRKTILCKGHYIIKSIDNH